LGGGQSKLYEGEGGFGRDELRSLRSNEKKGIEIWLHLCVLAEGEKLYGTPRLLSPPYSGPSPLTALHLAAMWRI
jgi:hypothetical protein